MCVERNTKIKLNSFTFINLPTIYYKITDSSHLKLFDDFIAEQICS